MDLTEHGEMSVASARDPSWMREAGDVGQVLRDWPVVTRKDQASQFASPLGRFQKHGDYVDAPGCAACHYKV
jgi:hypothetical protein